MGPKFVRMVKSSLAAPPEAVKPAFYRLSILPYLGHLGIAIERALVKAYVTLYPPLSPHRLQLAIVI
ncbi:hypothetical protein [Pelagibacterium limicola]|uniref:hypothetical protein n=1 Tax=Pelagibacterium limicola TaxID=2791022 RepID=UPI0018AFBF30|nr:hypothetical protein [Pelagibacterium limicola]